MLPDIADLVGGPSAGQAVEDALSEDDSDAAFAARHALLEAQEHAKFQTLAGGLPVAWCGLAVMWQGLSRVLPTFLLCLPALAGGHYNRTGQEHQLSDQQSQRDFACTGPSGGAQRVRRTKPNAAKPLKVVRTESMPEAGRGGEEAARTLRGSLSMPPPRDKAAGVPMVAPRGAQVRV